MPRLEEMGSLMQVKREMMEILLMGMDALRFEWSNHSIHELELVLGHEFLHEVMEVLTLEKNETMGM